jgi:hypothetical protein
MRALGRAVGSRGARQPAQRAGRSPGRTGHTPLHLRCRADRRRRLGSLVDADGAFAMGHRRTRRLEPCLADADDIRAVTSKRYGGVERLVATGAAGHSAGGERERGRSRGRATATVTTWLTWSATGSLQ